MDAVSPRAEAARAGLLAAAAALLVVVLAPPGGDSAAHLYRVALVRNGVDVWDNLWYAGQYPLASYSLLYYFPAAVVGNAPLVVAAVVVSAVLFAALAVREWGRAARWPARTFGVLAATPLFAGTYNYALGLAAALATLRLLQTRRKGAALACAALTVGASPLAFLFLCLALGAVLVARRRIDRPAAIVAAGITAIAALELLTLIAFPMAGRYPFSPLSLAGVLALSVLGAALAYRSERAGSIAPFFLLWGMASVLAYLLPSPFGDNLARLRELALPLVLLAAVLAGFRPRLLAIAALAIALLYNLSPDLRALPKRVDDARTAEATFWAPALSFLRAHADPGYRVEVVPTFGHWEAYWIPTAGFALARGWYRQLDLADNPELYRDPLSADVYRTWLRRLGVRYVLLPDARLGPLGAEREAALLRSGRSGLRLQLRTRDWSIYELAEASPILTGPALAAIDGLGHERIRGHVGAAGEYKLRVRYTRYWQVSPSSICIGRAADGMTKLVARAGGRFVLTLPEAPLALVGAALHGGNSGCSERDG